MRRIFADLHLRLSARDSLLASQVIAKAASLGYNLIAVPSSTDSHKDENAGLYAACKQAKIDLASRVNIRPRTPNELTHQLRRLRRKYELICVFCDNKEVARQAAKDHRVDLLNFPSLDFRKRFFDRAEAELACKSSAAFEVDMRPILVLEGPARIRFLSNLRREAAVAKEFHVPIIISSGVSDTTLLRKPRELAALGSLFGLDEVCTLEAVSSNPANIVKRSREKLSSGFVAPGIRLIKEGKSC
jgi:ribonuclease P/MRP protein subunit RPP1